MKKEFRPYHSQIDYETGIVDVQYEGDYDIEYDRVKVMEYVRESYPNVQGLVQYIYPPSESMGYFNVGIIGIK